MRVPDEEAQYKLWKFGKFQLLIISLLNSKYLYITMLHERYRPSRNKRKTLQSNWEKRFKQSRKAPEICPSNFTQGCIIVGHYYFTLLLENIIIIIYCWSLLYHIIYYYYIILFIVGLQTLRGAVLLWAIIILTLLLFLSAILFYWQYYYYLLLPIIIILYCWPLFLFGYVLVNDMQPSPLFLMKSEHYFEFFFLKIIGIEKKRFRIMKKTSDKFWSQL